MLSAYVECTSLLHVRVLPAAASRYEVRESPKAVGRSCSAIHRCAASVTTGFPAHHSCVLAASCCVGHRQNTLGSHALRVSRRWESNTLQSTASPLSSLGNSVTSPPDGAGPP